jgi:hypothetical protein
MIKSGIETSAGLTELVHHRNPQPATVAVSKA